jgi:hypothetical protein
MMVLSNFDLRKIPACGRGRAFVVKDSAGQKLGYFYYGEEAGSLGFFFVARHRRQFSFDFPAECLFSQFLIMTRACNSACLRDPMITGRTSLVRLNDLAQLPKDHRSQAC